MALRDTRPAVEVAEQAGACFGVERALALVDRVLAEHDGSTGVHTLGPLIHNPAVVDGLAEQGVSVVGERDLGSLPGGDLVVLRTHGVVPSVVDEARAAGLEVADATCPYVKKVHHAARRLADEGYQVVVVGEQGHPEVEGILGHAPSAWVIGCAEDLDGRDVPKRVGVVVQTTQSKANLDAVIARLSSLAEEVRLFNTICEATSERQAAAAALARRADVMVVLGGRNSANTTRLAQICSTFAPTHHIEGADELDPAWLAGAALVGVTAGASTPASQIADLVAAIESVADPS
ncbi:4-hydroxy-3-methylbut-2-enyl diphosphate reductase [Olsenella sp. YH-ols2217]|uniref:4-hydroxy-3-methylbut-2-enyl diphosphate reductase n=1 Tax=Kribbibacterium absianum TaxID=3044210 RepID=A0ABT6ZIQ5_9ACTN|nr:MULTISPECIES: 4-hydroxy-3-methylbut-2-enyl diphosphate reductase [unclassified Olsenella]MDJ1121440.1 4-hydroxy-3-methylbut-2-enyl diphosphate reductase [Olsenella sp. YH-ols2216]MDJ1128930.1 4-hydroxy-3-methylbut-2-enyl diphosphate reductase [Olsenella sp. YH-ols2217]